MRNRILSVIAVLWGGAILVARFVQGPPTGDSSFVIGTYGGIICGCCMFIGGVYSLLKGSQAKA